MGRSQSKERKKRKRKPMGFLKDVWHFVAGIPHDVFGDLLNTGLGIAAALCFTAVVITLLISAWRSLGDLAKAWDSNWNKDGRLEEDKNKLEYRGDGYTINFRKARLEQAVILRFSIPLSMLVLASMAYLLWRDFSWVGYWHIAVAWFIFAIPLRIWWIKTVKRASKSIFKHGLMEKYDRRIEGKTWAVFKFYVAWGVAKKNAKVNKRFFRYRLRRLNGLFSFLRLDLVSMRLLRPLFYWLFYVAIWPVAMVVSIFVLTHKIMDEDRHFSLKPQWASDRSDAPSAAGLYTIYEPDAPRAA